MIVDVLGRAGTGDFFGGEYALQFAFEAFIRSYEQTTMGLVRIECEDNS
jgi:hypothetical protein